MPLLIPQGFKDISLTIWQASCVVRNYELHTGKTVSHEDLDSGTLADEFTEEDYNLDESVRSYPSFSSELSGIYWFLVLLVFLHFSQFWIDNPHKAGGWCTQCHMTTNYCPFS